MLNHEAYPGDSAASETRLPARLHVVDNEALNRDRSRVLLTAAGYDVMSFATVSEAENNAIVPDLTVLACSLQEDAFENIRRLKETQGSHFAPLILLLTQAGSTKERGFEAGADHVLIVPYEESELLASIRALLRLRFLFQNLTDNTQELQRAYETLRVSEAKYRILMQDAPIALIIVDSETNAIIEINRQGLEFCGYESDALSGQPVTQLCAPEAESRLLAWVAEAQPRYARQRQEFLMRRSNGQVVPVEASAMRVEYEGKSLITLALTDLRPARAQSEAQLKAARQAAVAETAVTVSHEVNNALFVISSSAESLQQALVSIDSGARVKLERIVEACHRIEVFIHALTAITEPMTREYLPGMYMLDIERSTDPASLAAEEGRIRDAE